MSDRLTFGDRAADWITDALGSWRFLIGQTVLILAYITVNTAYVAWAIWSGAPFDPYPYILLNLIFSTQAAYAAPLLGMSQARKDAKLREYIAEIHATTARDATLDEDTNRIIREMAEQHAAQSALIAKIAAKVGVDG